MTIATAFAQLNEEGFFAREYFKCCNSCAWHAAPHENSVKGIVFYSDQTGYAYKDEGNNYSLSHAGDTARIIEVLREHGVLVEWNGNMNRTIEVIAPWEDSGEGPFNSRVDAQEYVDSEFHATTRLRETPDGWLIEVLRDNDEE